MDVTQPQNAWVPPWRAGKQRQGRSEWGLLSPKVRVIEGPCGSSNMAGSYHTIEEHISDKGPVLVPVRYLGSQGAEDKVGSSNSLSLLL